MGDSSASTTFNPSTLPEWQLLKKHASEAGSRHLRDLFATDFSDGINRVDTLSLQTCGLYFDFSKQRVCAQTLELLLKLAAACDLELWRERLFTGEAVNTTENRAALHMALRYRGDSPFPSAQYDVMPEVREMLDRMRHFCSRVRQGEWRGFDGQPVRTVVNIGIGGSDLGPAMAYNALSRFADAGIEARFVSNVDGTQLARTLQDLDPATTLFVISSKTFSTHETLSNANSARDWLLNAVDGDQTAIARHFVAVSTQLERTAEFGIDSDNVFGFWDWVGGRYSLWSAIGLPLALTLGMEVFEQFLAGGDAMDHHFRTASLAENAPVLMALLGVWNNNFLGAENHAVLPYDVSLAKFPDYLQQLEMESNGKSVNRQGERVNYNTGAILWGNAGNNGQHAFYQLIHQGTRFVPADFIVAAQSQSPLPGHDKTVLANAIAQTEAMMKGVTLKEAVAEQIAAGLNPENAALAARHRVLAGNQPTTTILYQRLEPETLGALIALYEHKVFVQSVLWNITPFDQFGVELGKKLAVGIREAISGGGSDKRDDSTLELIRRAKALLKNQLSPTDDI